MTLSLQGRHSVLSAAVGVIFGLAVGFGAATLGYRYGYLPIPGERPLQRMARVMQLTPAQREQIRIVMHETRSKIEAARNNFEQQRHAIFFSAYVRIHALLTPSQQSIFDARFVPPSLRTEAQAHSQTRAGPTPSATPGAQ